MCGSHQVPPLTPPLPQPSSAKTHAGYPVTPAGREARGAQRRAAGRESVDPGSLAASTPMYPDVYPIPCPRMCGRVCPLFGLKSTPLPTLSVPNLSRADLHTPSPPSLSGLVKREPTTQPSLHIYPATPLIATIPLPSAFSSPSSVSSVEQKSRPKLRSRSLIRCLLGHCLIRTYRIRSSSLDRGFQGRFKSLRSPATQSHESTTTHLLVWHLRAYFIPSKNTITSFLSCIHFYPPHHESLLLHSYLDSIPRMRPNP